MLDPFDVIDRFGADALRFYCCATSASARTARCRRGLRAPLRDASWPTSYGNLASRTLAMLGRYRDGAVPAAALDPELAADFEGLPSGSPSCSTAPS